MTYSFSPPTILADSKNMILEVNGTDSILLEGHELVNTSINVRNEFFDDMIWANRLRKKILVNQLIEVDIKLTAPIFKYVDSSEARKVIRDIDSLSVEEVLRILNTKIRKGQ